MLKAIILDFSTVNNMDMTAAQALIDVRNQLARYAASETVEWRFANIQSRWTKRALASAGFGYRSPAAGAMSQTTSIFSVADLAGPDSPGATAIDTEVHTNRTTVLQQHDPEQRDIKELDVDDDVLQKQPTSTTRLVAVHGLNRSYFHVDLQEALEAAIARVETEREGRMEQSS